jgi:glutamate carboxypeptidase
MIDELAALVRAESPSSVPEATKDCAEAVAALGAKLTGVDAEPIDVDGHRHLRWRLGTADPVVVLIGHFDTVWPLGTTARWPFSVMDGRATGPGSFDMKAGIVQMFHALAALSEADRDGVVCLLTSDEELGSLTSRALIEETAAAVRAALILEPSAGGALKVARKGTSMYEVHITGRAAHAGNEPEKGANATVELARQIQAVAELGRPDLGTTVTPTVAASGTTTNTVPAHAVLHVDVRCRRPDEQHRVDAAFHTLRPVLDGTGLEIRGGPNRPPFDRSASASLYQEAQRVAEALGLGGLEAVEVGGGSDGNFTAGLGVPTLDGLGPVGAHLHAEGEYVVVEAMPERAALLAGLVAAITRPSP